MPSASAATAGKSSFAIPVRPCATTVSFDVVIVMPASPLSAVTVDAAARNNVWLAYPMNPAPGQYWVLLVWIGLGLAGVFVQLAVTAKGKK